jgi:alkanesulfonate monooxygenase SsuD/methylene tetrahydromethanopterin reductase-like flavin-dependent oxidoreductase (luciferase family)
VAGGADRENSLDIDVLSKGRLTVGVGAGWSREEFEAIGAPSAGLPLGFGGLTTDEMLTTMKRFRDEVLARV